MNLFDLYAIIASWIGWPVVVAVILVFGMFGYWVLNNRIEGLKEYNDYLKHRINVLEKFTPDVLASNLSERHKILSEELERMNADKVANAKLIKAKETEITETRDKINDLREQLDTAQDTLSTLTKEFTCPYCGSHLETHQFYDMSGIGDDDRSDYDIEETTFTCGLTIVDGHEVSPCRGNS